MNVTPGRYNLADLMVDAELADDREAALELIADGTVLVNGQKFGMLDPVLNIAASMTITCGEDEVTVTPE
jgi:predicted rRNA methylase YqxC with S4 and FtsJ domains